MRRASATFSEAKLYSDHARLEKGFGLYFFDIRRDWFFSHGGRLVLESSVGPAN